MKYRRQTIRTLNLQNRLYLERSLCAHTACFQSKLNLLQRCHCLWLKTSWFQREACPCVKQSNNHLRYQDCNVKYYFQGRFYRIESDWWSDVRTTRWVAAKWWCVRKGIHQTGNVINRPGSLSQHSQVWIVLIITLSLLFIYKSSNLHLQIINSLWRCVHPTRKIYLYMAYLVKPYSKLDKRLYLMMQIYPICLYTNLCLSRSIKTWSFLHCQYIVFSIFPLKIFRYERWESQEILNQILSSQFENWMIYFWGIDPQYCSLGIGSASYKHCINILKRRILSHSKSNSNVRGHLKRPNIIILTHSDRAAKFHLRNGFRHVGSQKILQNSSFVKYENLPTVRTMILDFELNMTW